MGNQRFFEVRPGVDSLRYLATYGVVSLLARQKRKHQFFTEGRSNIDRHIRSDGYFEKGILDVLRHVITHSGHTSLMIDVGANIGNHTVALADLFERVEAVEPHPILFHVLSANILRNGLTNVVANNFGLANEDSDATLMNPSNSHGAAMVKERSMLSPERLGRTADNWNDEFPISLRSTQDFLGTFGASLDKAFIKIDVEGMEQEIVTAMLPVLQDRKPIIGFEWFTEAQPELGRIAAELDGYEFWGIHSLDAVGPNIALRGLKLLAKGREIKLERVDLKNLAPVYTLALLVPTGTLN